MHEGYHAPSAGGTGPRKECQRRISHGANSILRFTRIGIWWNTAVVGERGTHFRHHPTSENW